jgi:hypothetical protein
MIVQYSFHTSQLVIYAALLQQNYKDQSQGQNIKEFVLKYAQILLNECQRFFQKVYCSSILCFAYNSV